MAPSRHDGNIVDKDVKPQPKQTKIYLNPTGLLKIRAKRLTIERQNDSRRCFYTGFGFDETIFVFMKPTKQIRPMGCECWSIQYRNGMVSRGVD